MEVGVYYLLVTRYSGRRLTIVSRYTAYTVGESHVVPRETRNIHVINDLILFLGACVETYVIRHVGTEGLGGLRGIGTSTDSNREKDG